MGSVAQWAPQLVFYHLTSGRLWSGSVASLVRPSLQKSLRHQSAGLREHATMQPGGIPWAWGERTAQVPELSSQNFVLSVSGPLPPCWPSGAAGWQNFVPLFDKLEPRWDSSAFTKCKMDQSGVLAATRREGLRGVS